MKRKYKKCIAAIIVLLGIIMSFSPCFAYVYEGFRYGFEESSGNIVVIGDYHTQFGEVLNFPNWIDGKPVVGIGTYSGLNEKNIENVKTVNIPNNIKCIGYGVFTQPQVLSEAYFKSLEIINIGSGVDTINGFMNGRERINIVGRISLPMGPAFYDTPTLKEINVSENNNSFSSVEGVLYNKDKTVLIYVPKGKSGKLVLPDSVKSVDVDLYTNFNDYMNFKNCRNITELVLPDNLEYDDQSALNMPALEKIHLGDKTKIYLSMFDGCDNLKEIEVGENNVDFISYDGLLYSKNGKKLVYCPPGKEGVCRIMPGTTEIEDYVFKNSRISDVHVPDSVNEIGDDAFEGCKKTVTIHSSREYGLGYAASHGMKWVMADIAVSISGSGSNTVTVHADNYDRDRDGRCSLNIAVYDSLGALLEMKTEMIDGNFPSASLDLSNIPNAYRVKAMLWKDNLNIKPICEPAEMYVE